MRTYVAHKSLYVLSYLYKNIIRASTSRPNIALFVVHNLHTLPKK